MLNKMVIIKKGFLNNLPIFQNTCKIYSVDYSIIFIYVLILEFSS